MNWQPIETAPKDGKHILLWHPDYWAFGYYSYRGWQIVNNGDYTDGGHGQDYDCGNERWHEYKPPTHWAPLTKPIDAEQGAKP